MRLFTQPSGDIWFGADGWSEPDMYQRQGSHVGRLPVAMREGWMGKHLDCHDSSKDRGEPISFAAVLERKQGNSKS